MDSKNQVDSSYDAQDEEVFIADMFEEPEYYNTESQKPQIIKYNLEEPLSGKSEISLRLVGTHPLWGHYLWNAAKVLVKFLQQNTHFIKEKNILELGAASGLPSLASVMLGAKKVVMTDYPDANLIENMNFNALENFPSEIKNGTLVVDGFIWGKDVSPLLKHLPEGQSYDTLILSDLVFNHSEHKALLKSCKELFMGTESSIKSNNAKAALVFFSHHIPKNADKDISFFEVAQNQFGFKVEKVLETYTGPMFENDEGDVAVRGTVYGYMLTL
ncbi:hypothetical protein BB561_000729 [Smittium simulii]|uniref:Elongation factor methyltransferase 7 n=1 Tax=Smittium simulii TaxID=133385 RepID=A0A2T9YXW9_9FUNG|nr:hypothetical protein BB561_000729 [Smittium simulii]